MLSKHTVGDWQHLMSLYGLEKILKKAQGFLTFMVINLLMHLFGFFSFSIFSGQLMFQTVEDSTFIITSHECGVVMHSVASVCLCISLSVMA